MQGCAEILSFLTNFQCARTYLRRGWYSPDQHYIYVCLSILGSNSKIVI